MIDALHIPNYKKHLVSVYRSTENSSLTVAYFRYEKEKLSRVSEVKINVRKITINPRNYY